MLKISDVRQGVTLYFVSMFPEADTEFRRNNNRIERKIVTSRPVIVNLAGKPCYKFSTINERGYYSLSDFASTWRIGVDNNYNFHRAFKKRRHAQAYMDRINSGCLSAAERKLLDRLIPRRKAMEREHAETWRLMHDLEMRERENSLRTMFTQIEVRRDPAVIRIQGV